MRQLQEEDQRAKLLQGEGHLAHLVFLLRFLWTKVRRVLVNT